MSSGLDDRDVRPEDASCTPCPLHYAVTPAARCPGRAPARPQEWGGNVDQGSACPHARQVPSEFDPPSCVGPSILTRVASGYFVPSHDHRYSRRNFAIPANFRGKSGRAAIPGSGSQALPLRVRPALSEARPQALRRALSDPRSEQLRVIGQRLRVSTPAAICRPLSVAPYHSCSSRTSRRYSVGVCSTRSLGVTFGPNLFWWFAAR